MGILGNKARIEKHYDASAMRWLFRTEDYPNKYYFGSFYKTLYSPKPRGEYAIDLGCGAGTFAAELARYPVKNILALDFSLNMLQIVQKEKNRVIPLKGDAEHLPFKDETFDFIVMVGLVECVKQPEILLREVRRVLKKDGWAAIRWINMEGTWPVMEWTRKALGYPSGHFSGNFNSIRRAKHLINTSGLRLRRIQGMIILPLFIFPQKIARPLELALVHSRIAETIEPWFNKSEFWIRTSYYSFCTHVTKV